MLTSRRSKATHYWQLRTRIPLWLLGVMYINKRLMDWLIDWLIDWYTNWGKSTQQVRNTATAFHTPTLRSLTGVSSKLTQTAYFNPKHKHELLLKYLPKTTFRQHRWRHFTMENFKRLGNERRSSEIRKFTPKLTAIKTFNPSASGAKMQMSLLIQHRAVSCKFNQSQADALSRGTFTRGWGGEGGALRSGPSPPLVLVVPLVAPILNYSYRIRRIAKHNK